MIKEKGTFINFAFYFRAQDQLVVGCVQSAGAGVILTRPKPHSDVVPCEMSFTAHPMAQEFYIKNIVIVSEARNVELYIDDNYEKTARGIMLTIRKGRYPYLHCESLGRVRLYEEV